MTHLNTVEKADNLGRILAALLLVSVVWIWCALTERHMRESFATQEYKRLSTLANTQRELQGLHGVVRQQRTELLASRSVGLLDISPGPWMQMKATFYDGRQGINGTGTGITYSGKPVVSQWSAAADLEILPIGSIIEVEFADGSDKLYQVTDVGSAIRGYRLDLYDPDRVDCFRRGVETVRVRVLVKGK